jgi:BirA family transcriptional regulator, biotin operon repressor / biotin---[acetyl-CoA-carboxylase] ligase
LYKSPANTLFVGKNVVFVPECHSTNTLATQLSQNSTAIEGTVVITSNQTAGRGQRGNSWNVEPGQNLTLSLILKPGFLTISEQFFLNVVVSLAVRDVLEGFLPEATHIKWPNDILVHEKKICGILIENQLRGKTIETSVVGIGLNVNQTNSLPERATSLTIESKRPWDLNELFGELLGRLESRYLLLKQQKFTALKSDYLKNLYRKNQKHFYQTDSETFEGEITGVDDQGKLVVEVGNEVRNFEVKQIRYL